MTSRQPVFDRFAAAVADFGSPLYAEERQRDVWNEASAFGVQLFLWGSLLLGGVMLWVGGRTAMPYAFPLLALTTAASYLMIFYARRLGVTVPVKTTLVGRRLLAFVVVYAFVVAGAIHAASGGSNASGLGAGLTVGAGGALGLAGGSIYRQRRRRVHAGEADLTRPGL